MELNALTLHVTARIRSKNAEALLPLLQVLTRLP